ALSNTNRCKIEKNKKKNIKKGGAQSAPPFCQQPQLERLLFLNRSATSKSENPHAKQKNTISRPYGQLIYIIIVMGSDKNNKSFCHFPFVQSAFPYSFK
ncbi:hypothetical protein ACFQZ1_16370, partial [Bacillus sp. CGMCC 1.60114]|uniref:hypothetical protein n=1 Tax=unclassified Bacillus (in: firmicutes) TaxID=185979 RepID=UPI003636E22D